MLRDLLKMNRAAKNNAADSLLSAWEVVAGPDRLTIRPTGSELSQQDLAILAARLEALGVSAREEIEFDLSGVERIGPQWTVVLATLVHISRRVAATCRLTGLHGQPAAAVELYRRSASLMRLVATARNAA